MIVLMASCGGSIQNDRGVSETSDQERSDTATDSIMQRRLSVYLDYISDASMPLEARIREADSLSVVFDPNALIRVLNTEGSVVIDREPIDVFLGRVSSSVILERVEPISFVMSGGMVVSLDVKEYYKSN